MPHYTLILTGREALALMALCTLVGFVLGKL
jgi:hypothetical protein